MVYPDQRHCGSAIYPGITGLKAREFAQNEAIIQYVTRLHSHLLGPIFLFLETRTPGGNPVKKDENMQNSTQMIARAQDQTKTQQTNKKKLGLVVGPYKNYPWCHT